MRRERWAVFISGQGSNLRSILHSHLAEKVALVLSSKKNVQGIRVARQMAKPVWSLNDFKFEIEGKKKVDWLKLTSELEEFAVNRIFLAGFMKIVPEEFVSAWEGRMLNLHPSLLPLYPGLDVIEKSFKDGADMGVTIHQVNEEVDAGKILVQRKISRVETDFDFCRAEVKMRAAEQRISRFALERAL